MPNFGSLLDSRKSPGPQGGPPAVVFGLPTFAPVFNVKTFGAKGDGVTDDTTAAVLAVSTAPAGSTVYFPGGTYLLTSIPSKHGVTLRGEAGQTIIRTVNNGTGNQWADGGVAVTMMFYDLIIDRAGTNVLVSGGTGSARYGFYVSAAATDLTFYNCRLLTSSWNVDNDDVMTSFVNEAGTVRFYGCYMDIRGRGIYMPSGGAGSPLTWWEGGNIRTSGVKALAIHAGVIDMIGSFEATGALNVSATISMAGGTVRLNGIVVRSGHTSGQGVFNTGSGATAFITGTVESSGPCFRSEGGSIRFDGISIGGTSSAALVLTGGTLWHLGNVFTSAGQASANGVSISGGTLYWRGDFDGGGVGISITSAGTVWYSGNLRAEQGGVDIADGSLRISGSIQTAINGITFTGATPKVVLIDDLEIEITGANAARRALLYGASTNNITTIRGRMHASVPSGAASSISTNGGNAQVITAGLLELSKPIGADITIATVDTGERGGDLDRTGGYRQTFDGWYQDNVAASQTNVELNRAVGRWTAPRAGSVTAIVVHSTEARTGGTLTVDVFKNTGLAGAAGASIGLTAVLDATNTSRKATTQAKDTDAFAAGDELYVVITTDGSWTPTTSDIRVAIEVET